LVVNRVQLVLSLVDLTDRLIPLLLKFLDLLLEHLCLSFSLRDNVDVVFDLGYLGNELLSEDLRVHLVIHTQVARLDHVLKVSEFGHLILRILDESLDVVLNRIIDILLQGADIPNSSLEGDLAILELWQSLLEDLVHHLHLGIVAHYSFW